MNNFHTEGGWKGPAPLPRLLNLPSHHVSGDCLGGGKGRGSDTLENLFFIFLINTGDEGWVGGFLFVFFFGLAVKAVGGSPV